jgi:hypothetical protein
MFVRHDVGDAGARLGMVSMEARAFSVVHASIGFGMESFDLLRSLELPERAAGGGGSAAVLALALACVSEVPMTALIEEVPMTALACVSLSTVPRAHPLLGGRLTGDALAAAPWFLASSVSASSAMVCCTSPPMDGDGDAAVKKPRSAEPWLTKGRR